MSIFRNTGLKISFIDLMESPEAIIDNKGGIERDGVGGRGVERWCAAGLNTIC